MFSLGFWKNDTQKFAMRVSPARSSGLNSSLIVQTHSARVSCGRSRHGQNDLTDNTSENVHCRTTFIRSEHSKPAVPLQWKVHQVATNSMVAPRLSTKTGGPDLQVAHPATNRSNPDVGISQSRRHPAKQVTFNQIDTRKFSLQRD